MKSFNAFLVGLLSLSMLVGYTAKVPSLAQSASESAPTTTANKAGNEGYGKNDIDEFCARVDSDPQPGIQFDGVAVAPEVAQLSPGVYQYPNRGMLALFSNNHFLLQLPTNTLTGTAGPDLVLPVERILGGCSVEQLSEALIANGMSVEAFALTGSVTNTRSYGKEGIDRFCEEPGRSVPQPGTHFDGEQASPEVMALATGRYEYGDGGLLLFFENKHFLLKLSRLPQGGGPIYGTDGDDLLDAAGMVGGCSPEQLSEALLNNGVSVGSLELVALYE